MRVLLTILCLWLPLFSDLLEEVDSVRNPSDSYALSVFVDETEFAVAIQGAMTRIEPKSGRDRGRNMLMIDENMWVFIPNLKRAVRVSLSQRLTGEAANGDISRMRWAGDYDYEIELEDESSWQLFLSAKKKGLTYDKIRVTVEKGTHHPQKAEYLSVLGSPLKYASFQNYREIAGRIRPTEILIEDVKGGGKSLIKIHEMEAKDFPSAYFSRNQLDRELL